MRLLCGGGQTENSFHFIGAQRGLDQDFYLTSCSGIVCARRYPLVFVCLSFLGHALARFPFSSSTFGDALFVLLLDPLLDTGSVILLDFAPPYFGDTCLEMVVVRKADKFPVSRSQLWVFVAT